MPNKPVRIIYNLQMFWFSFPVILTQCFSWTSWKLHLLFTLNLASSCIWFVYSCIWTTYKNICAVTLIFPHSLHMWEYTDHSKVYFSVFCVVTDIAWQTLLNFVINHSSRIFSEHQRHQQMVHFRPFSCLF